ncbi:MAG: DUF1080 domain-containing protein, partial [Planctomycetota bacterium]
MNSRRQFLQYGLAGAACTSAGLACGKPSGEWRSLFDGKTLDGWKKFPRIYFQNELNEARTREDVDAAIEKTLERHRTEDSEAYRHRGDWKVVDGAIVGGQDPPGSRLGAYLMTEETFGDFELEYEMRPDWRTDTGVLVRQHRAGTIGFQVLCDHRPGGGIGGFFTNGLGSYLAAPVIVDGDVGDNMKVENMREGESRSKFPHAKVSDAATYEQFRDVWNLNGWNRFRVRCVGANPVLTAWINDLKMGTLDSSDTGVAGYDPAIIGQRVG